MLEAVATPCLERDSCWWPVPVLDDFPFVSLNVGLAWAVLYLLCLIVLIRRLGRG